MKNIILNVGISLEETEMYVSEESLGEFEFAYYVLSDDTSTRKNVWGKEEVQEFCDEWFNNLQDGDVEFYKKDVIKKHLQNLIDRFEFDEYEDATYMMSWWGVEYDTNISLIKFNSGS